MVAPWDASNAVPIIIGSSMDCAATTMGCATACATTGTLTMIGEPAAAPGGHTTCMGPLGVVTWNGIPGLTPSGMTTCICWCVAMFCWKESNTGFGLHKERRASREGASCSRMAGNETALNVADVVADLRSSSQDSYYTKVVLLTS